jgi:hypothetical protein
MIESVINNSMLPKIIVINFAKNTKYSAKTTSELFNCLYIIAGNIAYHHPNIFHQVKPTVDHINKFTRLARKQMYHHLLVDDLLPVKNIGAELIV